MTDDDKHSTAREREIYEWVETSTKIAKYSSQMQQHINVHKRRAFIQTPWFKYSQRHQ